MNRKGITAIMDAAFFIILIALAVSLLSQYSEGTVDHDNGLADNCENLMLSELLPGDIGYEGEWGLMKFTDLWAVSLTLKDGRGTEFAELYLSEMYPWADTYGLMVSYGDASEISGKTGNGWKESVTRSYPVTFGGEIVLTVYLYQ